MYISSQSRTWFVTGASRGLGRAVTEAALADGDRVVGVARDVTALDDLRERHRGALTAYPIDVTDRAGLLSTMERADSEVGPPDVLVCNAGQLLFGMVEEVGEQEARRHLEVNLFGALWAVQAALPGMRARGGGHILLVTAQDAGGGSPGVGLYSASKAALNALGEALAAEAEGFGVRVTLVEPGPHETGLDGPGLTLTTENEAYAGLRTRLFAEDPEDAPAIGRPQDVGSRVVEVSRMERPPKRVVIAVGVGEEYSPGT